MRSRRKDKDVEGSLPVNINAERPDLLSIQNDGFLSKRSSEDNASFELRLRSFLDNRSVSIQKRADGLISSILLHYIRHLNEGYPRATFQFRLDSGEQIADGTTIDRWKASGNRAYTSLRNEIELAERRCESLWIDHLGKMAKGEAGGQIKAMEMYMKRFFGWDVDSQGREEAQAVIAAFEAMGRKFKEKHIDIGSADDH